MTPVEGNDEQRLADTMAALSRSEARAETPDHVEAAVMNAWDSYVGSGFSRTFASSFGRTSKHAAALAAGVLLTMTLGRLGQELRDGALTGGAPEAATLLLVGEPILEGELVRVVRMRMPAATLANLGMRSTLNGPAASVDVDVIVGEDGVARAIRF
jgi:hypothetical protein